MRGFGQTLSLTLVIFLLCSQLLSPVPLKVCKWAHSPPISYLSLHKVYVTWMFSKRRKKIPKCISLMPFPFLYISIPLSKTPHSWQTAASKRLLAPDSVNCHHLRAFHLWSPHFLFPSHALSRHCCPLAWLQVHPSDHLSWCGSCSTNHAALLRQCAFAHRTMPRPGS